MAMVMSRAEDIRFSKMTRYKAMPANGGPEITMDAHAGSTATFVFVPSRIRLTARNTPDIMVMGSRESES
ncbi:MAG: hypothetical protein LBU23_13895 [Planctomycetota bacterium]|nr:hypothetical protein [Planctomycetota bacterium]